MASHSSVQTEGSIEIVLGCMYSGKTTEIIKECKKWNSISKNALCINFSGDTRYSINEQDTNLYSHDLSNVKCLLVSKLSDVPIEIIELADVILINEGQFFCDLIDNCRLWCEKYKKNILVSGLDGDFQRQPFGQILDLIPYANHVRKMNAFCSLCKDGTLAQFTLRLSDEKEQIVIGSKNYIAVCRKHYLEKMKL